VPNRAAASSAGFNLKNLISEALFKMRLKAQMAASFFVESNLLPTKNEAASNPTFGRLI
jgi:hypothetical protein